MRPGAPYLLAQRDASQRQPEEAQLDPPPATLLVNVCVGVSWPDGDGDGDGDGSLVAGALATQKCAEHVRPAAHWFLFSHRLPSHWFQCLSHWAPPPVQKHVPSLLQPDGHPCISHVCAVQEELAAAGGERGCGGKAVGRGRERG